MTRPFALLCLASLAALPLPALAQGTQADYDRAAGLRARFSGKLTRSAVFPHWFGNHGEFWYKVGLGGGKSEYVIVDPAKGEKRVAVDLASLPGARATLPPLPPAETRGRDGGGETEIVFENRTSEAVRLFWVNGDAKVPYGEVKPGESRPMHTFAGHAWLIVKPDGTALCGFIGQEEPGVATITGEAPKRAPRKRDADTSLSPDGKMRVIFEGNNVALKSTSGETTATLTTDGSKENFYGPPVRWSPDGRFFTVARTVPGENRKIPILTSAPKGGGQPTLRMVPYEKPGDRLAVARPRLFDAVKKIAVPTPTADALTPSPFYGDAEASWSADSKTFTFSYNERGHRDYKIVEIETETGQARALIDERAKTFIDWTNKVYFYDLPETNEALWMSERDGWNHLYLIDRKTGAVKNQVTKGPWVVRGVESVDVKARTVTFRAGGIFPDQDPYHVHYAKVGFDGRNLVKLTAGDGTHKATFSPDGKTLVDTYSRVDLPPVSELRSATDGKLILALETADASALQSAGWKAPERFVAKGRDGTTDIWGLIFRPTNFDPKRTYPVIENIYAGPHGQHVPKSFSEVHGSQELAELGFVVVQIDGMGTNWRSKSFHDVCWKNLADAGFLDRILWLQAAQKKYPQLDLGRVGIYGTSAGGQNALDALLLHGDFYKAGVADCGCVDNRMDKVWWNEQWMGWPIGPEYAAQSGVTLAPNLTGKLFLMVGQEDTNVDPSSTLQVVDALIRAGKDFDFLMAPNVGHGVLSLPYARRRMQDFFVRNLLGVEPRQSPSRPAR